jgi:hypothetical protein
MAIRLRGHHLLCLLGYRGKGYSDGFCANMTNIYETLRAAPETPIELIEGPDDICEAFPSDQIPHCENESVYEKDQVILAMLGLAVGTRLRWSDVCERVRERMEPGDIASLCANCRWEPLGLCREGVGHIHREERLRPLPGANR